MSFFLRFTPRPSRKSYPQADWIDANQLGRRNLNPDQASLLRGRRYNRAKKGHGGDRKASGQNVHLKTAEELAAQHGVDERTIRRDGEFALAVEKVKKVDPEKHQPKPQHSFEITNLCAELKLRAERRIGEMLAERVEHGGDRKSKSQEVILKPRLSDMGISPNESHRWQRVASVPGAPFPLQR